MRTFQLFAVLLAVSIATLAAESPPTTDGAGWAPLFAVDLADADKPTGVWSVANGELTANADHAIWTKTDHENFTLDLEFKNDNGTNSGVIIYCTDTVKWIPKSVEVQIADPFAEKWAKANKTWHGGGIFGHLAPAKQMTRKPGEWNHMILQAKGKSIKVWLNGTLTVDMDMAKWTSAKTNPDGTEIPAWLSTPFAELPTKGRIGLQGKHGAATVWFRNVRIKADIPVANSMLTEWGTQVTPENAWREYPRPMMQRKEWTNLNGLWDYALTPKTRTEKPDKWDGKILVPFAIESALSGVKKPLTPDDALWYERPLEITPKPGKRYLLHFDAVDYQSTVWINNKEVGRHRGGNLPFSFDVTSALQPGVNTLRVHVTDATDSAHQLHGKQLLRPHGCFYTAVSGIWQTVWIEEVSGAYISDLKISPRIDGTVQVKIDVAGNVLAGEFIAKVTASLNGKQVAEAEGSSESITLRIPEPKLWSPDSPTLYDLSITLGDDTVTSYVGLRETTMGKDAAGNLRFHLNGKEIFHLGPLDQGWWPDGLLTPPSDVAMRSDLEYIKASGFNMLRKHIKVEPRRYYHHCDKMGLLVWQDQVSAYGKSQNAPWTRLKPDPVDAQWPEDAYQQYMSELKGMIDLLHNHPSIVQWVPFNEAWGQHRTMDVGKWVVAYDPTRQINIASGGNLWPIGHIVDHHEYPHPAFPFDQGKGGRFDGFVKVIGEFGGHGFPVEGHLWNAKARNWGYGGLPKDKEEWMERYKTSIKKLVDLKKQGIAAGIYTQTTDVEGEINGLITYDRKVRKVSAETLAAIHREAGITD